jgi:sugar transferase (PEP-CTERM/EpsH1 system associated)
MKILFLTSRLPYPPHRGDKLKIFNLLRHLSKSNEITLLSFVASADELRYLPALREFCRDIHTIHHPPVLSVWRCMLAVFSREPFQIAYFSSGAMRDALRRILDSGRFDVIHTHLVRMAQYTREVRGTARLLDLTDAGSLYLERFHSAISHPLKKLLVGWELGRLKRYEQVISEFDTALVCSPVDRDALRSASPGANLDLLYNGIDLEYFTPPGERQVDPERIIYTGNLSYFPNADGIAYFVREILPLVRREIEDVKLYIVGKDPPRNVRRLAGEGIVVTGFVEDIRREYLASAVAVAPIRFGAGTLNKVLEPLALGVPVVTSSIGIEGLPLKHGEDLLVADSPGPFAESVIRILRDPSFGRRLALSSAGTVRRLYDWRVISDRLVRYYREIARA